MRVLGTAIQDKDEAVAYTINWSPDLNGGTLSAVTWTTGGLTSESEVNTSSVATIRLAVPSTVSPGQTVSVTCTVTTSQGEDLQAGFNVQVEN